MGQTLESCCSLFYKDGVLDSDTGGTKNKKIQKVDPKKLGQLQENLLKLNSLIDEYQKKVTTAEYARKQKMEMLFKDQGNLNIKKDLANLMGDIARNQKYIQYLNNQKSVYEKVKNNLESQSVINDLANVVDDEFMRIGTDMVDYNDDQIQQVNEFNITVDTVMTDYGTENEEYDNFEKQINLELSQYVETQVLSQLQKGNTKPITIVERGQIVDEEKEDKEQVNNENNLRNDKFVNTMKQMFNVKN